MQSGNRNLSRERSGGDFGKRNAGYGGEIPKEETYNKYGDASRKIEILAVVENGAFARILFLRVTGAGVLNRQMIRLHRGK